ncbi:MAG TPA: hypothetical protein VLB67_03675 [Acidimicrobiia bacterium]|nr:hypothetical protein [Acidimicrobiia bacterium]
MGTLDTSATRQAMINGGSLSRQQLLDMGFTARQIEYRVSRGYWTVVRRGVYEIAAPRDRRDLMRAVIGAWAQSVVSHESAAELHEFPFVSAQQRVIVSNHTRTTHDYPGVEVRRTHDLDAWHVTAVDGIRSTTIARTVVDLAQHRTPRHIGAIVDRLVTDGRLELVELDAVLRSTGRRGKPGTTVMREVLERRMGDERGGSELERRGRVLIERAGLPMPIPEFPVPWSVGRRFDDAYPLLRIAIEWDSRRFHGQVASFEADRLRDRDAAIHGWVVLRFTWDDVHRHPNRVVETLLALLAA